MRNTTDMIAQKKFLVRRFAAGDDYRTAYEALRKEFKKMRLIKIEDGLMILNEFKVRKEAREANGNERRLRRSSRRVAGSSDLVVPENDALFQIPSDSTSQKTFLKQFFQDGRSFTTAYNKLQTLFPNDVLPMEECQTYYLELQKSKADSESPAQQPRGDQPVEANGPGQEEKIIVRGMHLYEVPIDSTLENIEEFFLDHEDEDYALPLNIGIRPGRIILHQNDKDFLYFTKTITGTCFVEHRGVKELHQSNFIELSLSTLVTLLRSKNLDIEALIIRKCEADWEETNHSTWLEFLRLFNRLKNEIFSLAPIISVFFNKREDFTQLGFLNLNIYLYICKIDGEDGLSDFPNIDAAEMYAHDNYTTVKTHQIFVTIPTEYTPRVVMENPSRMNLR